MRKDLTGQKFGRLTALAPDHTYKGALWWRCRCDCGNEVVVSSNHLVQGTTRSCGCYAREVRKITGAKSGIAKVNYRHGGFGTKLYNVWAGIIRRCENPNQKYYKDYGGRGISVCSEWRNNFAKFRDWAFENGYQDGLTIERINNDGDYEPGNCRWIPMAEQFRNRRNSILIEHNGKTYTLREISEIGGIKLRTVIGRYERGDRSYEQLIRKVKRNGSDNECS